MYTGGLAVPQPCRLDVKFDSISLLDICTESSECHPGFCNSGSGLYHQWRECFPVRGIYQQLLSFCPLTLVVGSLYVTRFWLVYNLLYFCADCEIKVTT